MLFIFLKCWCYYSDPGVNFFFDISTLVNTSSKVTQRLCLFQFFVVVLYSILLLLMIFTLIIFNEHDCICVNSGLGLSTIAVHSLPVECWLYRRWYSLTQRLYYKQEITVTACHIILQSGSVHAVVWNVITLQFFFHNYFRPYQLI